MLVYVHQCAGDTLYDIPEICQSMFTSVPETHYMTYRRYVSLFYVFIYILFGKEIYMFLYELGHFKSYVHLFVNIQFGKEIDMFLWELGHFKSYVHLFVNVQFGKEINMFLYELGHFAS